MRIKPRFSILNLLLLTTVVILVIVVGRLSRELKYERDLRIELLQKGGILQVSDPNRIHVVRVAADGEQSTRRWRIYVPEGRKITLDARMDDMPIDKPPVPRLPPNAIVVADRAPVRPIDLGPGEHVVSLLYRADKLTAQLSVVGNAGPNGRSLRSSHRNATWHGSRQTDLTILEHTRATYQQMAKGRTLTVADGKTFVLFRFRTSGWLSLGHSRPDPVEKASEVLIWLHADER